MQIRFIRLIDELFQGVPQTQQTLEMKEEIVQNLMEKYNDLRADGKSEEDAFTIAAASVGDIDDIIGEPTATQPREAHPFFETSTEEMPVDDLPTGEAQTYATAMSWPRVILICAVLFAMSPVVAMLFKDWRGLFLVLTMTLGAVGLFIYQGIARHRINHRQDAQFTADAAGDAGFEPKRPSLDDRKLINALTSALWIITVAAYFLISFAFGGWHITWVIFLIATAISNMLRAAFGFTTFYKALTSALWVLATAMYFIISFATGAWHISWLIFLFATVISNVLRAVFGRSSLQRVLKSGIWLLTTALFFIISFATGAWHITWIIFLIAAAVSNVIKASMELKKR